MKRLATNETAVRQRERYHEKVKVVEADHTPIGRTGLETCYAKWRKSRNGDGEQLVFKDRYHLHLCYQTRMRWEPLDNGGVFSLQMVLQGHDEDSVLETLREQFNWRGKHICVSEELNGTDRRLFEAYVILPKRPSVEEATKLYQKFCG